MNGISRGWLFISSAAVLAACNPATAPVPPGPAAKLVAASPTTGAGFVGTPLQDSLVVRVTDANNRPVPGVTVNWAAAAGGGSVSPRQSLTDEKGRARTAWQLGTRAGVQTAFAEALTVSGPQLVEFSYTVAPGAAAVIRIAPEGAFLGLTETRQFTALRLDIHGNAITDRPVAWVSSNPGAAKVDAATGMVTAVALGTADITATTEGRSATARVLVGGGGPAEDLFESNSLGQYTQYSDAPASWSIAGGVLTAEGTGRQSHLIRNGVVFRDGWVEAQMDRADEGGLVLRFNNPGYLYLLSIHDDGSLLGTRNLELFRRTGGAFQLLAFGKDINWPRGTVKTVRFEVIGTSLRGYVDGALVIEATDAAISTAGGVGARYNDVPEDVKTDQARYLNLRWSGN